MLILQTKQKLKEQKMKEEQIARLKKVRIEMK